MREPKTSDLVEFVCRIQPELDPASVESLLQLEGCREWVALRWHDQRVTSQSLLDLHLERTGTHA